MKVSRPAGVLLLWRMGLVIIELLLIGGEGEENGLKKRTVVMQCYCRGLYGRSGYRKRMHAIWNEMIMFSVTE